MDDVLGKNAALRAAVRQGVREGIADSGLPALVAAMERTALKAIEAAEVLRKRRAAEPAAPHGKARR